MDFEQKHKYDQQKYKYDQQKYVKLISDTLSLSARNKLSEEMDSVYKKILEEFIVYLSAPLLVRLTDDETEHSHFDKHDEALHKRYNDIYSSMFKIRLSNIRDFGVDRLH